jgi:hypothetical protein
MENPLFVENVVCPFNDGSAASFWSTPSSCSASLSRPVAVNAIALA